jgi:transcriptional regulator with XRE-family HTH domain
MNEIKVGTVVKNIRISKGMSAKHVSEQLGISPSTLSKYESNDRKISADLLPDLAKALGVGIEVFFNHNVGESAINRDISTA